MALKQKRTLAKTVKVAKEKMNQNRGWTAVWGLWLLTNALSIGYRTISIPMLLSIYHFFAKWTPPVHSHSPWLLLWNWAYTELMFWPLIGFLYLCYKLITFRRRKPPVVAMEPIVLFENEISAAILAIDAAKDDVTKQQEMEGAIVALLDIILETIAVNLGLRKKDFRMYLVVPKSNDKKRGWLSGFRLGQAFVHASQGKTSAEDFEELLEKDRARVDTFLTEYGSTVCFTKSHVMEQAVLMMARNPGKYLRMGLYIAVTKPNAEIDDFRDIFVEVAGILSTIGFIDEIVDYVRQYGQGGS